MRILVVEDEPELRELLQKAFAEAGFTVDAVGEWASADADLCTTAFDAVLLDLGLPDGDGLTLLRALRRRGTATPVLVLTARDALEDRVSGLDAGADDYVVKPFYTAEVVARIRALLRRPGQALGLSMVEGNVTFDTAARSVEVDGAPLVLTRRELALLELLMRQAGRVISKAAIEDGLYGFDDEVSANAIEVLVHRLRRRLAGAGASIAIHTLRGIGYMLTEASG